MEKRLEVTVRSDNLAALFWGAQMKFKASGLIAKEVALVYAESAFEPRVFTHLPGITNNIADKLSRLSAPDDAGILPVELTGIMRAEVPLRNKAYYKNMATP